MVTQTDVLTEVAEAEAAGLAPQELNEIRGQVEGASALGMGMAYHVPATDAAAWVPAWRLELDFDGLERGKPVPLPKDRLGYYLSKKREVDGGRLFTLKMPERLQGERKFQCFIVPNVCAHRADTKTNLIEHMEMAHPRESLSFKKQIDQIRDAAANENPALQSIVAGILGTPDPGNTVIPQDVREEYDAGVQEVAAQAPEVLSITRLLSCQLCEWTTKPEHKRPDAALKMHVLAKHKDEVE